MKGKMKRKSKPTHPSAPIFAKNGFFKNIKSWKDLKGKISKLNSESTTVEGDAFEVFTEMYLKVIKKSSKVIPARRFTGKLRKKFHYPTTMPDAGADGLYLAENGQWTSYQAKFRSNQKSLTWGELGTFFGVSEYTPMRHVITTCQEIVASVNEMKGHDGRFSSTREEDLDRLTEEDFELMAKWLDGVAYERKLIKPRPYQQKAVNNICRSLKANSRTQTIMACGTGKTLVALWAAKKMNVDKIVIFVPSLGLMRQTYQEWMKYHRDPDARYLAVCSDKKVKGGETQEKMTDSEFPATTDVEVLRKQMRGAKKIVVFCTYQSVGVLTTLKKRFDLGIFDEAHKTVGKDHALSATALFDSNIKIKKRLFLTATPKHHRYADSGLGRWADVLSMSSEEVYGKRNTQLFFSEARDLGVISDFKVVVSFITTDEVNRHLLNTSGTRVKSDDVRAIQVADQLAVRDAMEKFNINKIFSFHNTVDSAREFVCEGAEGIGSHIGELECFHVNGRQSSGERQRILKDFTNAKKAIVSNAKCLTEGIDVPAVDCVAFIHPKKSSVDIVQAVGRAMRKFKGKKFGYLLIPIYVEQEEGEAVEQAIERTNYDKIIAVARAMREHSDELEGLLELYSTELGRGRIKGSTHRAFDQIFDVIGTTLNLDILKRSVVARVLGTLRNPWDVWYGQAQAFKQEHGHLTPSRHEHRALSRWLGVERGKRRKSQSGQSYIGAYLTQDKIDKLDKLGMIWEPAEAQWEEHFLTFKSLTVDIEQTKVNGKIFISQEAARKWKGKNKRKQPEIDKRALKSLDIWLTKHRTEEDLDSKQHPNLFTYYDTVLNNERVKRLDDLGFCWSRRQEGYYIQFLKLKKYLKEHKSFDVPFKWRGYKELNPDGVRLQGLWNFMKTMRSLKKNGYKKSGKELSKKWIDRLDSIGFPWEVPTPYERNWNRLYKYAEEYYKKHGDINVARGNTRVKGADIETQFKYWINNQRSARNHGKLTKEQIKKLDAIGIEWNPVSLMREKHLDVVKEAGTTKLPYKHRTTAFLVRCRMQKKTGHLNSYIERELNKIGDMDWEPQKDIWEGNFDELKKYLDKFGDWPRQQKKGRKIFPSRIKIPESILDHSNFLYRWMFSQIKDFKNGDLSKKRIKMLKSIDFPLGGFSELDWNRNYELAKLYYLDHGHINMLQTEKASDRSPGGCWIAGQRAAKRNSRESWTKDKTKKLEALNIVWDSREVIPPLGLQKIKPKPNTNGNFTYRIAMSSTHGVTSLPKGEQLCISYPNKEKAQKALDFLQKEIDKNPSQDLQKLRDLVYQKISKEDPAREKLRKEIFDKIIHLREERELVWPRLVKVMNDSGTLSLTGKKWTRCNVMQVYKQAKDSQK
jgi:superfamily II DNA or RNA helicase